MLQDASFSHNTFRTDDDDRQKVTANSLLLVTLLLVIVSLPYEVRSAKIRPQKVDLSRVEWGQFFWAQRTPNIIEFVRKK